MRNSLFFLLLLLVSCTEHKKEHSYSVYTVSDKEIYSVINHVLEELKESELKERTHNDYVLENLPAPFFLSENPSMLKEIKSFFTEADLKFMDSQIKNQKGFKLKQDHLNSKTVIPNKIIDSLSNDSSKDRKTILLSNYHKRFGNNYYHYFSLPIFSLDKQIVIVDRKSFFGGSTVIYKKEKGKWVAHRTISY